MNSVLLTPAPTVFLRWAQRVRTLFVNICKSSVLLGYDAIILTEYCYCELMNVTLQISADSLFLFQVCLEFYPFQRSFVLKFYFSDFKPGFHDCVEKTKMK